MYFYSGREMTLTIEKNVIAEERLEELLQILEKNFLRTLRHAF